MIHLCFVIMGRKILYYHALLQKKDEELVKTVFQTQQKFSVKNDWIIQLNSDLDECNISLTENEIKEMKKEKFKTLVNKKIKRLSNEYLMNLQQSHRKSRNVFITENIKSYLISDEISVEQKRLLFLMRNFMCDVKQTINDNILPTCCVDYVKVMKIQNQI